MDVTQSKQSAQPGADEYNLVTIDPVNLSAAQQYKLLAGSVVPRPIALVTTISSNGPNAAPFSFFNVLAVDPPMVMFSIGTRPSGAEKDTLRNLREHPELVIHIVDVEHAHQMNLCSAPHPADVNEIDIANFTSAASKMVRPPRILECPVQFECKLESITPYGKVPYHLVIAQVVYMHFRQDIVGPTYSIDQRKLNPVGRIAGPGMYIKINDMFQLPPLI
jgi:flavin reductase (DIM6/NTAB) family NADH-FMN oxidoreductase RutF